MWTQKTNYFSWAKHSSIALQLYERWFGVNDYYDRSVGVFNLPFRKYVHNLP